jgi:uncharacterized membrane protein (UPF0127 family)
VSGERLRIHRWTVFAVTLVSIACHGTPKAPAEITPAAVSGPRVVLPSGAVYAVELARTPEEQAQGLMYRESLAPRAGMIFLFRDAAPHQFWMKNTMIPLDIVWLDESGRVLFVSANTPPCRADPCPSYGPDVPASTVLEIAGGMAAKERVTVGSTIRLQDVPQ